MKLPGGSRAIVERQKLKDYCLDPSHPRGKHKARVFSSVLGFTADDAERLAEALLASAATGEAQQGIADMYGERYVLDSVVSGPRGTAIVRSTWIVRRGQTTPRLTSCFVK